MDIFKSTSPQQVRQVIRIYLKRYMLKFDALCQDPQDAAGKRVVGQNENDVAKMVVQPRSDAFNI